MDGGREGVEYVDAVVCESRRLVPTSTIHLHRFIERGLLSFSRVGECTTRLSVTREDDDLEGIYIYNWIFLIPWQVESCCSPFEVLIKPPYYLNTAATQFVCLRLGFCWPLMDG